ncbi:MAG: NIL domain-containing protein [bacterium]
MTEPLLWRLAKRYQVITNIRTASVSDEIGLVGVELEGAPQEIDNAVAWLREQDVTVEPVELDIIE